MLSLRLCHHMYSKRLGYCCILKTDKELCKLWATYCVGPLLRRKSVTVQWSISVKHFGCSPSKSELISSWEWQLVALIFEIQPVHSEGDQPWVFFRGNDPEAETPVIWPPHVKSWLIGKDSDAGRDWGQEEKGTTEDEMAGWHHRLDECESEWTPGVGDGQGGLACCDSWGRKESDTTEWLN